MPKIILMTVPAFEILCVGRLKKTSPFYDLLMDYSKRLITPHKIIEIETSTPAKEQTSLLGKINPNDTVIALDETGKTFGSTDFAKTLNTYHQHKSGKVQFMIGGADGLNEDIRARTDLLLSFGKQTWPHMMVRVMLMEQIYRAQQILSHHPYHRE